MSLSGAAKAREKRKRCAVSANEQTLVTAALMQFSLSYDHSADSDAAGGLRASLVAAAETALCDAYGRSLDAIDVEFPSGALLESWMKSRRDSKLSKRIQQHIAAVEALADEGAFLHALPLPVRTKIELRRRLADSLFDYISRLNCAIPSAFIRLERERAWQRERERPAVEESSSCSNTAVSCICLRQAFVGNGKQRENVYASSAANFAASMPSVAMAELALLGVPRVQLQSEAADAVLAGVPRDTTLYKFFDVEDKYYVEQDANVLRGAVLHFTCDSAKSRSRNQNAKIVSGFVTGQSGVGVGEFGVIFRKVLAIGHLNAGTGAEFDSDKRAAMADAGLDERAVGSYGTDEASALTGVHNGMVAISDNRLGTCLTWLCPCLAHGFDHCIGAGLDAMCGTSSERLDGIRNRLH